MPSIGEVRPFAGATSVDAGAGVGNIGSGEEVAGAGCVGAVEGVSVTETGQGVAGGATGVGWQAALRKAKASRQAKSRVVIDIQCLADKT